LPTNRLLGISVGSYLDTRDEPVALSVKVSALADGTIYVERSQLEAKAKGLGVVVENSGYRRLAP
jgi:hypothetical protein